MKPSSHRRREGLKKAGQPSPVPSPRSLPFLPSSQEMEELEKAAEAWKGREALLLAFLLQRLAEERESSNALLRQILQRLERIEAKLEEKKGELLSEQDEAILAFIKQRGGADAEEVRRHMGYKGRNAASARLNRLVEKGLLKKKRVGKRIVFLPI